MKEALDIQVKGVVQGVGFRPFVYRLAKRFLISGWVLNGVDGVFIHAEGESNLLDEFVIELSENAPAASRVEEIDLKEVPLEDFDTFEIRFSDEASTDKTTLVSPDLATCAECEAELFNPNNRRFRYPFINCTNCGPRFTITDQLPYDRKHTSMKDFAFCETCAHEYADPLDRRFHAQPDACFDCGPHLSWCVHEGGEITAPLTTPEWGLDQEMSDAILAQAVDMLMAGKILAVKGLGGFHLVCDAQNADAVALLRERKHREGKPFAVMAPTLDEVREFCQVNATEADVLQSTQRPIVLLRKRPEVNFVPRLADALPELGVMLPYTPLQHLLLHDLKERGGSLLVMTSGNISDEPIVIDDAHAYEQLFAVADGFIGNDRAILVRFDDSVVRVISAGGAGDALQFVRRSRGYAPMPLPLSEELRGGAHQDGSQSESSDVAPDGSPDVAPDVANLPSIFATGPEQKNTFTLTRQNEAFVSQHIGDMENAQTFDAWLATKARFESLFEITPQLVACDVHPEYLTSKWAHEQDLPVIEVQHHQAHITSVLGEHGLFGPVCGIAFDGTGYGPDGALWGGEVLLTNTQAFERFVNFAYVPMPGGAACIKHPLRMAYGVLWAFDLLEHPGAKACLEQLGEQAAICEQMIERGLNTPMTSSVGRLFDAASALLGVCTEPRYEGEPAILLEACMETLDRARDEALTREAQARAYEIQVVKNTASATSTAQDTSVVLFDAATCFEAMLDDVVEGVALPVIARRFHNAFVQAVVTAAELARSVYDITTVALSGGVFMNRYLIEHALVALENAGFTVAINRDLPPNDGCISFGEAVVAWASNHE